MVSLEELLQLLVQRGGSDLHIASGSPPRIRIDGKLMPTEFDTLTKEESQKLVYGVLSEDQIAKFEKDLELDFSFGVDKDRKSTRLNSSHSGESRMPSSA